MALGAVHPRAQEQLSRVVGLMGQVADCPVPDHRRMLVDGTLGGNDRPHELVVGHVRGEGVANPGVEGVRAPLGLAPVATLVAQDVSPLHGPEVGVLVACQKLVDRIGPAFRVLIGQKRSDFVGRGERADRVEVGSPQERGVVRQRAGHQLQLLPLGLDQLVDVVARGKCGPLCGGIGQRHGDAVNVNMAQVAGHHGRVAGPFVRGHQPFVVDVGHVGFVALELSLVRHVARGRRRNR